MNGLSTGNSEIFARIQISRIALKECLHINFFSLLGHDLPISVRDEVISPFREGFIIKTHAKISEFTVH